MADRFLELSKNERSEILQALGARLGRSPAVLEKDVWVCWALDRLFSMPGKIRMAFKGGTSLSKVYDAIHRFSEDVDVTLDYRELRQTDTDVSQLSRSKQKKLSEELKTAVRDFVHGTVKPYFEDHTEVRAECNDSGEEVRLHFESALDSRPGYLADSILLEFGGRNITEPSERHTVDPDIAAHLDNVVFPSATIDVLAGSRTFWEKATLIHSECNRGEFRAGAARLSRHWYDLALLADHRIGSEAVEQLGLLQSVVDHKCVFFHSGFAKYEQCLAGAMRLVPEGSMANELERDYRAMIDAGMFYADPPSFADVLDRLARLEHQVNECTARSSR